MKRTKHLLLTICLLISTQAWSATLVNGIYYELIYDQYNGYHASVAPSPSGYTGNLTIPISFTYNGITYIVRLMGENALQGCTGLTSISLPATMADSPKTKDCSSLTSISVDASNYYFSSKNGILFNKNETALVRFPAGKSGNYTIPSSVTSIEQDAFSSCGGLTSVTIPSSVTSIGQNAFSSCGGLTSVTIPSSVTSIGKDAFKGCSGLTAVNFNATNCTYSSSIFSDCSRLTSFTIGAGVKNIPNRIFSYCSGLTAITIPSSVTSIGDYTFSGCSGLTSVTIPNSVTSIGDYAFYGCSGLTGALTIPSSVTSIGSSAFSGCSGLTGALTIPSSVTSIGYYTFSGCSGLTGALTIPSSVTSIGSSAFSGCSKLTSVTIPNSVTSIGQNAFYDCIGLTGALTIPSSVTSIGYYAFEGCDGLTSVTIPSSVTSIGSSAFSYCYGLTSVTALNSTPVSISSDIFLSVDKSRCKLYVPYGSAAAYKAAGYWKEFVNIIELPEGSVINQTPTIDGALIEWQSAENATGYRLVIYTDAAHTEVARILVFNAAGQLVSQTNLRAASSTFGYTVTGLSSNTPYYYTLETLGAGEAVIISQSGSFTTLGATAGIVEPRRATVLRVYPNPTDGKVRVESGTSTSLSDQNGIKVFDLQGKQLLQTVGNEVDLSAFAKGVYLLQADGQMVKVMKK